MLVTGATYPKELGAIREVAPDVPFLVPGIGAQGGDLSAVLQHGLDRSGRGLLISSSRGIIYAQGEGDFQQNAAAAAAELKQQIHELSNS